MYRQVIATREGTPGEHLPISQEIYPPNVSWEGGSLEFLIRFPPRNFRKENLGASLQLDCPLVELMSCWVFELVGYNLGQQQPSWGEV